MDRLWKIAGLAAGTAFAFFCISGSAFAAVYERVEVPASSAGPVIEAMVWSPCATPPAAAQLGPYDVRGTPGCAVEGDSLPLVAISHGFGGTLMGHHDTAAALADAGFVVVALNHPGDTYGDDSAAHQVGIFESRPGDVSRVISFMLEDWRQRQQLDPGAIGVFGFSRGGYTALALAGAEPSLVAIEERLCAGWSSLVMALCRQVRFGDPRLEPRADPRIRAAVVVDPLNLFDDAGVQKVRVPVQLWASELGGDGVEPEHVAAIRTSLPTAPEYHVAKGAGHFAYLAPCTPRLGSGAGHLRGSGRIRPRCMAPVHEQRGRVLLQAPPGQVTFLNTVTPSRNSTTAMMIAAQNRNLAIPKAPPAMPPKPRTPAMMPITAKMMAHLIMSVVLRSGGMCPDLNGHRIASA